eukprot:gnl/MRDRNA2_/MRDRNA2_98531_c0_seq1.p1 gnl/MRDRNA2_/MRDRNA2_98531_c0~~gnl/MRDRNA2_/MRDRNA2_98531_c0_seq1.p1  ORF type:complete len:641 (+),score=121.50 gnl/MRDRNA2_/MRDRNA2_98531_c0_seq1:102-2024(+)
MRNLPVYIPFVFMAWADARDLMNDKVVDNVINKLTSEALQTSAFQYTDLDNTTLGKPGHVAMPQRTNPGPIISHPPSAHSRPSSITHASFTHHTRRNDLTSPWPRNWPLPRKHQAMPSQQTTRVATADPPETAPAAENDAYKKVTMDEIVSLCKRRGFVFPSSEIYNGFNGFYDYGPLGVEVKNNIKKIWWRDMVHRREDVVGIDSSIICAPKVWNSSGHLAGFVDPMVDCKETNLRYRADQLFFSEVVDEEDGKNLGYVTVMENVGMEQEAMKMAKKIAKDAERKGAKIRKMNLRDVTHASDEELAKLPSPATGKAGTLTPPRDFNLMFSTQVGPMSDSSAVAYLRPETAQGIFINFKNVESTSRVKFPFGIAQIGKAFRNEITPRNFVFRSREFEQMEIEYFIPPGDEAYEMFYNKWIDDAWSWLKGIGLREDLMNKEVHTELAHYARACTDITFKFPFGESELQGIAARSNYDLTQHQTGSGKSLQYVNAQTKDKFVPHCIEPSIGVDRLFLAVICSAYAEDEIDGEKRQFLRFHPLIAPVKVAVFPLVKNKEPLFNKARSVFEKLQLRYNAFWDATGAIGRRYRRMDEIGTPYCITVDFDTLEDDTVTVRERDSTKQERMKIDDLIPFLSKNIDGL